MIWRLIVLCALAAILASLFACQTMLVQVNTGAGTVQDNDRKAGVGTKVEVSADKDKEDKPPAAK